VERGPLASERQTESSNLRKVDDLCCDECWIKKMMRGAKLKETESDMRPYEGAVTKKVVSPATFKSVTLHHVVTHVHLKKRKPKKTDEKTKAEATPN